MSPYIAAPWILWDLYSSETANPMSFPHVLWISLCSCTLLHWSPIHFLGLFETFWNHRWTDSKASGILLFQNHPPKISPPQKSWQKMDGFIWFRNVSYEIHRINGQMTQRLIHWSMVSRLEEPRASDPWGRCRRRSLCSLCLPWCRSRAGPTAAWDPWRASGQKSPWWLFIVIIYIYSFSLCRNLTIITLINLYNKRWLDVNAVIVDFFLLLGASECRFFWLVFWLVHEALPGHGGDSDVIPFFQASWFPHLFSSNVAWIVLFGRCILNFLRSNSFCSLYFGYRWVIHRMWHFFVPCLFPMFIKKVGFYTHDGSMVWYINANTKGVYWWDPWSTIYSSTMDPMGGFPWLGFPRHRDGAGAAAPGDRHGTPGAPALGAAGGLLSEGPWWDHGTMGRLDHGM